MIFRCLFIAGLLAISNNVTGLTMGQFSSVCKLAKGECSENPILQAYVGGALDLMAALNEETEYMQKIYCKKPNELFNTKTIIPYMQSHHDEYAEKNAMLVLIRYLEERGGCPAIQ